MHISLPEHKNEYLEADVSSDTGVAFRLRCATSRPSPSCFVYLCAFRPCASALFTLGKLAGWLAQVVSVMDAKTLLSIE